MVACVGRRTCVELCGGDCQAPRRAARSCPRTSRGLLERAPARTGNTGRARVRRAVRHAAQARHPPDHRDDAAHAVPGRNVLGISGSRLAPHNQRAGQSHRIATIKTLFPAYGSTRALAAHVRAVRAAPGFASWHLTCNGIASATCPAWMRPSDRLPNSRAPPSLIAASAAGAVERRARGGYGGRCRKARGRQETLGAVFLTDGRRAGFAYRDGPARAWS